MSVALDFGPEFADPSVESVPFWPADYVPDPVPFWPVDDRPERVSRLDGPLAEVIELPRRGLRVDAPPVRLTRRGVAVLSAAVAVLSAALVWAAWLSSPSPSPAGVSAATVTVHPGDTLWSIATRVAPDRDPRAEIATLQKLNHLTGVELSAGQVLRTR